MSLMSGSETPICVSVHLAADTDERHGPVRDHSGATVAAMSVSAPIIRWTAQAHLEWTKLVREGAATLSARMGHRAQSR